MLLAIGSLLDINRSIHTTGAEKFHTLARAALCEISVLEDTTVDTITALYYELWFLLMFSEQKKSTSQAWAIMGLTTKLAQSVSHSRFMFLTALIKIPSPRLDYVRSIPLDIHTSCSATNNLV